MALLRTEWRRFENNYSTEMCSGSEAGSYLRLTDCVYQSTKGVRVKKKRTSTEEEAHPRPKVSDVRLPGKGNSNSHGARPVHLIITMIKWFRTSR